MSATSVADMRLRLGELLAEAAELEHGLLCQYLFAAFSFKRSTQEGVTWQQLEMMRGWQGSIMIVARQEMEHLGYVCNLLTAIGEAPYFARPNFPLSRRNYEMTEPFRLARFGPDTLRRFIVFEIPQQLNAAEQADLEGVLPGVVIAEQHTIAALYREIRELFDCAGEGLFVAPRSAQTANPQILPSPIRGIPMPPNAPVYEVLIEPVTDVPSAQHAIDQIVLEGEGTPGHSPTSHFARFCKIAVELTEERAACPAFDPARPVVDDPERSGAVSDEATLKVSEQFNLAYGTMLLLLIRFFAHADESARELAGIQHVAFFPMMTTVIRPLGEILTLLPAVAGGTATAGPVFRFSRTLSLLPHRRSAWKVIGGQLTLLADRAATLAASAVYPEEAQDRLTLMAQNLQRMASDFRDATESAA